MPIDSRGAADLKDFLLTIGVGGALAVSYIFAIRSSDRTAVGRTLIRYHEFWSRAPLGLPARTQLWVLAVVFIVITLAALITLVVRLSTGTLQ